MHHFNFGSRWSWGGHRFAARYVFVGHWNLERKNMIHVCFVARKSGQISDMFFVVGGWHSPMEMSLNGIQSNIIHELHWTLPPGDSDSHRSVRVDACIVWNVRCKYLWWLNTTTRMTFTLVKRPGIPRLTLIFYCFGGGRASQCIICFFSEQLLGWGGLLVTMAVFYDTNEFLGKNSSIICENFSE